jgi:hypothetical protein
LSIYFKVMEETSYKFKRSMYDPALDHLIGKGLFKEKHKAAEEFLIKHGLPKEFYEKGDSK